MEPGQESYDCIGLVGSTAVQHIALRRRCDIFEPEHSTLGDGIGHAKEKAGNAPSQELPALAAKEQLALDRGRRLLLDDEGARTAAFSEGGDAMNSSAQAVLRADASGVYYPHRAVSPILRGPERPAEERRIEHTVAGGNRHDHTLTEAESRRWECLRKGGVH